MISRGCDSTRPCPERGLTDEGESRTEAIAMTAIALTGVGGAALAALSWARRLGWLVRGGRYLAAGAKVATTATTGAAVLSTGTGAAGCRTPLLNEPAFCRDGVPYRTTYGYEAYDPKLRTDQDYDPVRGICLPKLPVPDPACQIIPSSTNPKNQDGITISWRASFPKVKVTAMGAGDMTERILGLSEEASGSFEDHPDESTVYSAINPATNQIICSATVMVEPTTPVLPAFIPSKPMIAGTVPLQGNPFQDFPLTGVAPFNMKKIYDLVTSGHESFALYDASALSFDVKSNSILGDLHFVKNHQAVTGQLLNDWLVRVGESQPRIQEQGVGFLNLSSRSLLVVSLPQGEAAALRPEVVIVDPNGERPQPVGNLKNVTAIREQFSGRVVATAERLEFDGTKVRSLLVWRTRDLNEPIGPGVDPGRPPRSLPLWIGAYHLIEAIDGRVEVKEAWSIDTGLTTLCGFGFGFNQWNADGSPNGRHLVFTACNEAGERMIGIQRMKDGLPDETGPNQGRSPLVSLRDYLRPLQEKFGLDVAGGRVGFLDDKNLLYAATSEKRFFIIRIPLDTERLRTGENPFLTLNLNDATRVWSYELRPRQTLIGGLRDFTVWILPNGDIVAHLSYTAPSDDLNFGNYPRGVLLRGMDLKEDLDKQAGSSFNLARFPVDIGLGRPFDIAVRTAGVLRF